jgi:hypothetical protein
VCYQEVSKFHTGEEKQTTEDSSSYDHNMKKSDLFFPSNVLFRKSGQSTVKEMDTLGGPEVSSEHPNPRGCTEVAIPLHTATFAAFQLAQISLCNRQRIGNVRFEDSV